MVPFEFGHTVRLLWAHQIKLKSQIDYDEKITISGRSCREYTIKIYVQNWSCEMLLAAISHETTFWILASLIDTPNLTVYMRFVQELIMLYILLPIILICKLSQICNQTFSIFQLG